MRILQNVTQEITRAHAANITEVHSPHEVKDPMKNECQRSKDYILCVQNADIPVRCATYSNTLCDNN